MELNSSMGIDVSEYELRSSYSCSRIGCIAGEVVGEDKNADSSWVYRSVYLSQASKKKLCTSHAVSTRLTLRTMGS
jgi:hypothetical protein